MPGRAPSAHSPTPATTRSQSGERRPEITVIGRMYFIEKPVRIDLHHLSFARRSYRRAILPEEDRTRRSLMKPTLFAIATVLPLLAGVVPTAHAVECAAGVVRAGCAGPNGAVVAGPRGAAAAGTNGMHMRSVPRAGTTATGARGNTATKAVAPGCAFVNGQRVCR